MNQGRRGAPVLAVTAMEQAPVMADVEATGRARSPYSAAVIPLRPTAAGAEEGVAGANITSIFGYDQNDPRPSCFGDVMMATATSDLNPFSIGTGDVGKAALGAISVAKFNQALTYAASKGLTSPSRSSVFRNLMSSSKVFGELADYAPLAGVVVALGHGLWCELQASNLGQCQ